MRRVTPFRIAAVLLIVFCAGHTAGGMLAQNSSGTEADAVFAQMKAVHFAFQSSDCTWYGFWFGFGMTTSLFLLLSAIIAWQLEKVPPAAWSSVAVIAYSLVAVHAVNTFLSWKYFFIGPAVFSAVITALLAWGTSRKKSKG